METFSADSDDVSVGGATTLTSSWMEKAPSIHLSCAQPPLGTCSCRMTTRHWRTNSCWSKHLDLHRGGDNAGNSVVMPSKIPWNKVVPYDSTTRRTALCGCRRRTLCCSGTRYRDFWDSGKRLEQHFDATGTFSTDSADVSVWELVGLFLVNFRSRLELCVVIQTQSPSLRWEWKSTHCTNEIWQEQHFCATKMFGADGDEVFVWRLVGLLLVHFRGRFMHCVVIRADEAQFLFDVTNKPSLQ